MTKSKFDLALERMKEHQQAGSSGGPKTDYVKVADGEYAILRILPAMGNMEIPWQLVGRHYFGSIDSILCPAFTTEEDEECILCDMRAAAVAAQEKKIPKHLNVRRSYHFNVIERKLLLGELDDKGRSTTKLRWYEGPKVWTPGIMAFKVLGRIVADPLYGEVWNVEEGVDIKLDREGEGMATEWTVLPRQGTSPVFIEDFDFELDDSDDPQWNIPADLDKVMAARVDLTYVLDRLPTADELLEKIGLGENTENEDDWAN